MVNSQVVLVDGRSGAGKTEYARVLGEQRGALVVSIDEVYPGWDGLDAGSAHIYRHLLAPLRHGKPGRYQRWNWREAAPGEWVEVDARTTLVVEGCGAIRHDAAEFASESLWLECPDDQRHQRAMARDGELYRPQWERWARQEERFLQIHRSPQRASATIWGE